jgi:hypothetical protein
LRLIDARSGTSTTTPRPATAQFLVKSLFHSDSE